jgi:hypothetical protein
MIADISEDGQYADKCFWLPRMTQGHDGSEIILAIPIIPGGQQVVEATHTFGLAVEKPTRIGQGISSTPLGHLRSM